MTGASQVIMTQTLPTLVGMGVVSRAVETTMGRRRRYAATAKKTTRTRTKTEKGRKTKTACKSKTTKRKATTRKRSTRNTGGVKTPMNRVKTPLNRIRTML